MVSVKIVQRVNVKFCKNRRISTTGTDRLTKEVYGGTQLPLCEDVSGEAHDLVW